MSLSLTHLSVSRASFPMHFYANSLWILQKKKRRKLKYLLIINFTLISPTNSQRMFCQFLFIYIHLISAMSLIDLNFSAGKVKRKEKKTKRKMRIYLIFYLYRDVEAPPRIDTDISLGDVKCVCSIDSRATPATPPPPPKTHSPSPSPLASHSNNYKKILCQFPWADDGGHQSPQYTTVYVLYSIYDTYRIYLGIYVFSRYLKMFTSEFLALFLLILSVRPALAQSSA